jgi:hypothetical protein
MKNQDMKQNGGSGGEVAPSWWESLSTIVTQAYTSTKTFTSAQLDQIAKLIGENPGTAVATATLAGIALSTYLHIRMQGTDEEKKALDRKIREARRESEESSDSNSNKRRRKSNRQRSFSEDGSSSSSSSTKRRRVNKSNRVSRGSRGSRRSR